MAVIDINWNPSRKELRVFAVLQVVFFAIIATVLYNKSGSTTLPIAIVAVSAVVGVIGFFVQPFMRAIYVVWMFAVWPIGLVVSHVVLAIVFYLVLTPIGIIMKLCGRDPMERKFDKHAGTYWIPRQQESDTRRYFRQF